VDVLCSKREGEFEVGLVLCFTCGAEGDDLSALDFKVRAVSPLMFTAPRKENARYRLQLWCMRYHETALGF
jgi:hypothetical protein